jgi:NADPH:quinone reductase-like Zn-dependent oxidoreductase
MDWKIRDGNFQNIMKFQLPLILGFDAAGVVTAVGAGVTNVGVGQAVYGIIDQSREDTRR